jgi:hypothetical protein
MPTCTEIERESGCGLRGARLKLSRRAALANAVVLSIAILGSARASASKLEKLALKIAAGTAPVSLAEFVRQTGLQVLFDFDAVSNVTTREINGRLDAKEALLLMFEGSSLTFEFINDRTIAVRLRPPAAAPAAQPQGGS